MQAWPYRQECRGHDPTKQVATDELFAKHIEPEPAPKDRVEWAMAEESDADEEGTPPHADADEPDQIDVPPALPMSNLEWCFALRLICGAGPR